MYILLTLMYIVTRKHLDFLKKTIPRNQARRIQAEHNEKFDSWFKDYVSDVK